jgi:hypothetical protein
MIGNEMMFRRSPDQRHLSTANSFSPEETPEKEFISARYLQWIITILLVYFGLRLLFFSITISEYVPPDEVTHVGLSRIYSKVFFLPKNSPETYEYGLVTNIPYLYYWIMGKFLPLNFFGISDLLFLRFLNIPFAFATVYFAWRLLRLLTDDRLTQMLLMVAMTNTLMFSFLSGFVSYDNLTNLLAAMAVFYLLAFFKTRSGDMLAVSFLCQMAGSLTKLSFLPLALVLNLLLVMHEFKSLRVLPAVLLAWLKSSGWRRMGLVLGISLGLALNMNLYCINYIHYGSLIPAATSVLSLDDAMQNRMTAQNIILTLLKGGRISREKALELTSLIKHPGDRADAIALIQNYAYQQKYGFSKIGPLAYIPIWGEIMLEGIFGISAHLSMPNRGLTILPFVGLLVLTGLSILLRWRPRNEVPFPSYLMMIASFYGLFLMYYVNYATYLDFGSLDLALQGRYIFPVLVPIYVVSSYYLLCLVRSGYLRLGLSVVASFFFIAFDFPYYLFHVTSNWFMPLFR